MADRRVVKPGIKTRKRKAPRTISAAELKALGDALAFTAHPDWKAMGQVREIPPEELFEGSPRVDTDDLEALLWFGIAAVIGIAAALCLAYL